MGVEKRDGIRIKNERVPFLHGGDILRRWMHHPAMSAVYLGVRCLAGTGVVYAPAA